MKVFKYASLGSGSKGNCLLVSYNQNIIVVDCGFTFKEFLNRFNLLDCPLEKISSILVTHEHSDHIQGVTKLAKKLQVPVWMTTGTLTEIKSDTSELDIRIIEGYKPFDILGLTIKPFPVPHDAREPAQFYFAADNKKLGILTDLGMITTHILDCLIDCNHLILECNHDKELMRKSKYPQSLKKRILGDYGHLSNDDASDFLKKLDFSCLKKVTAAHISEINNDRKIVNNVLSNSIGSKDVDLSIATQNEGFSWIEIH